MKNRLKQRDISDRVGFISFMILAVSVIMFAVSTVSSAYVISFIFLIITITSMPISIIFQYPNYKLLKPVLMKNKTLDSWKNKYISFSDAQVFIYGCGKDTRIKIGIPKIDGATIIYNRTGCDVSDVMQEVLDDKNLSPYEFYVRYVEYELLEKLNTMISEEEAERRAERKDVYDFIESREVK